VTPCSPTLRQLDYLRAIDRAWLELGYAPSIRELGDTLGIGSTNGVAEGLKALERRGLVTKARGVARSLRLTTQGRLWITKEAT
jgi:repressor LexA